MKDVDSQVTYQSAVTSKATSRKGSVTGSARSVASSIVVHDFNSKKAKIVKTLK